MLLRKAFCVLSLMSIVSVSLADGKPLAADYVQLSHARMQMQHGQAALSMTVNNTSDKGEYIIAAMSPDAGQGMLKTFVHVHNRPVNVRIHAISLPINSVTQLTFHGKHIELDRLNKPLNVGEYVPVTVVFRDGSYETVSAQVV